MLILIIFLIIILLFILLYYKIDNFNNYNNTDKYDIVYSILAHENTDFLLKLINNIKKYNKNYKILILFHLNDELYKTFKPIDENVLINDIHYDKQLYHHSLTQAHFDNYNYLIKNNINFKYILLLASNCMFIKQINITNTFNETDTVFKCDEDINKIITHSCRDSIEGNKYIMNCFKRDNVCIYKHDWEGSIYTNKIFGKIVKYIEDNNIFNNINHEFQFEEILLPTLMKYFNLNKYITYGKVFWDNNGYYVNEIDIDNLINDKNGNICIVKRVPRDINSTIFKYIDQLPE